MNEVEAAAERLRAAIEGKVGPKRCFAEVGALDVATVGASIAADKHTEVTRTLVLGATGANPKNDPELKVHQYADQVVKLLELAGV